MFDWKRCPKCGQLADIPTYLEKYAITVHTDNALSIAYKCWNCGSLLEAHISYQITELTLEGR